MAAFASPFTPAFEIGWRLDRPFRGNGYALEGARACLATGFGELELTELISFTSELNLPSISVMRKIGLRHRRDFLHPAIDPTHRSAKHVLYGINRTEYEILLQSV